MTIWNDFIDWIKRKPSMDYYQLVIPKDFPYNDDKYHTVTIGLDEIRFVGKRGRTRFFSGQLKMELSE